ncbi:amino acid permease [Bacillus spizizenii]|uniref:D-Serine/D-alanine/glycine permease n=1 Tax=Bacillus spizizenii (strain ATCC 23059 / NRRL B-14472 / W23) TaxID=655816 RepID=E0TTY3_BACSH|nr:MULTISPECIES: amino acid permease [Bacillus subtilis group]QDD03724.1 amino acid permease [Bacillus subtilis]ADM38656.1 D-Serine/D-alanine/glycine permease [Bacillus spizizenii str. W23]AJW84206.1 D-alanine/D-serine/glycine permease [Bacillus spizizenii]EFG90295.1 d-Serine/d-alanine/glycine permease [Bacillus spizizenii ATCC 6633 = JCM 2499]MBE0172905.1 amino acid permease [Bacillus spizizenii]
MTGNSNKDNLGQQQKLSRGLKNRHIQLMAIGGAIGTGLFLGSGKSIHFAGPSILFAYLITGVFCFFIMRSLGELLLSNTGYHSFVDFVRDYLGNMAAFITGWTYWFCWISLAMADLTAVGIYTQYWLPDVPQWLPGLLALIILLIMNLATVKLFGELEFWFALIKVIAILALIVTGIFLIAKGFSASSGSASLTNLWKHGGMFPNGWHGFILSFQMVVFAFVGIELVGLTAGETENPQKVIPKAINQIPTRILLFYVGALFVIMCIYPWNVLNPNESPFVQVFSVVGIVAAASMINFVVLTSAASAANSALFSTSRMVYSLAKDHHAPGLLKKLTSSRVPSNALFFSTIAILIGVSLNYIMPEQVFTLITSVSTICFIFIWGITVICHLKYRKTRQDEAKANKFKMPFYPLSNYLTLAFLAFILVVLALANDTRVALFVTPVWFILLIIMYKVQTTRGSKVK